MCWLSCGYEFSNQLYKFLGVPLLDHSKSIFSFVRNSQTVSQIGCTISHSHPQGIKVLVALYPCQQFYCYFFFVLYLSNICVLLYFWRKNLDSWVAKSCGFMPVWLISSKNSKHQGLSEMLLLATLLMCFHIFLHLEASACFFLEFCSMLSLYLLTFICSLSL